MRLKNQHIMRNKLLWIVLLLNNLIIILYIFFLIFVDDKKSNTRNFIVYFKLSQFILNIIFFTFKEKKFNLETISFLLIFFNILCYISSLLIHYYFCLALCSRVFGYYIHYFFIALFFCIFINFYLLVYWIYFEKLESPKHVIDYYQFQMTQQI